MPIGYVYEIYDKRTEESVYVGSTTKHYMERWSRHLYSVFRNPRERRMPVHKYMLAEGPEHFDIRVREEVFWDTNEDLRKREQLWIDNLNPRSNVYPAYVTPEDKKGTITCECGKVVSRGNISYHRITAKHLAFLLKAKLTLPD